MMAEKIVKYRGMSTEDLFKELKNSREELMNLRFQQATGELTDHTRLSQTRQQVARLLTILRERELNIVGGGK
jgi:large subunit ribosomal protein L29